MTELIKRIGRWIGQWFGSKPETRTQPLKTVYEAELPERLEPHTVYVLGEGSHRWFVALLCPCGCGTTVQVSLLPDAKPSWQLHEHQDGTISVEPSIWGRRGCRSHFFLRRGLIEWCG